MMNMRHGDGAGKNIAVASRAASGKGIFNDSRRGKVPVPTAPRAAQNQKPEDLT
jgi:hypothetical protein